MQPTKYATEFQINSTVAGAQSDSTVVALADGRFVAAWTDASGFIRGRIFGADATPVGNDFVIGAGPAAAAGRVHLTALSTGGFAATWQETVVGNVAIVAQVFSNTGAGGAEFQVSAAVAEDRILARVVQLSNGNLKFIYQDQAAVPSVLTSTYSTAGAAIGVESPVTAVAAGDQTTGLVNLTGGKYAVVSATGGAGGDVQLQIFNNAGTALAINGTATPYIVNTTTTDTQVDAKVVLLSGGATTGDLAVTWTSTEHGGGL
jgi:hypothetical protein